MSKNEDYRNDDPTIVSDAPQSRMRWLRRLILYFSFVLLAAGLLSAILFSPLFLRRVADVRGVNWTLLGNIGQTYGAASAILSAIALLGIAVSLVLQRHQARAERIRIVRERQTDLLRIALDNPEIYAPVIGFGEAATADTVRRFFFASMWMNYSRLGYEMGILTEQMLREEIFPAMFGGAPAREWWGSASYSWSRGAVLSRRDRQFARIANEEYGRAVKANPSPIAWDVNESTQNAQMDYSSGRSSLAAGMIIGVAIGIFAHSRMRKKS